MRLNRVLAATLAAFFVGGCSTHPDPDPDKSPALKAVATVGPQQKPAQPSHVVEEKPTDPEPEPAKIRPELQLYIDNLRDGDAAERRTAAQNLSTMAPKLSDAEVSLVVPALVERLHGLAEPANKKADREMCQYVAEALGKIGSRARQAAQALVDRIADDVLDGSHPDDERALEMSLAQGIFDDVFGRLYCTKDAALKALKKVAPKRVREALMRAAKSEDSWVKNWALLRLGSLSK